MGGGRGGEVDGERWRLYIITAQLANELSPEETPSPLPGVSGLCTTSCNLRWLTLDSAVESEGDPTIRSREKNAQEQQLPQRMLQVLQER